MENHHVKVFFHYTSSASTASSASHARQAFELPDTEMFRKSCVLFLLRKSNEMSMASAYCQTRISLTFAHGIGIVGVGLANSNQPANANDAKVNIDHHA
jgi:hypothetical protein